MNKNRFFEDCRNVETKNDSVIALLLFKKAETLFT